MKTLSRIPWAYIVVILVIGLAGVMITRELHEQDNAAQGPAAANRPTVASIIFGRTDLTGRVTVKGGGALPGPARVYIASAAPKKGVGTVGANAYPDCGKQGQTDARGGFVIKGLDAGLTFQVMAVADGYQPVTVNRVDPAKGQPLTLALVPLTAGDAAADHQLSGRVLDGQGQPIAGALVEVQGLESKDGGGRYGGFQGLDREALTDGTGAFRITDQSAFFAMQVKVSARSYADKTFNHLASGTPHDLVLGRGSELHGRVTLKGKPLAGVSAGISGINRGMAAFLGHYEIGTDAEGVFDFKNLPADGDFELYTMMSSMGDKGAAVVRQVHTGGDGETVDAGDLVVEPAYRLAGQVVLADDRPVPAKSRMYIVRENGWDNLQVTLGKDGGFSARGIPPAIMSLSLRINGYHLSPKNASLDQFNMFQLVGRVDHDITNLVFLLEKGPAPTPDYRHMDPDYQETRNRPLAGVEGGEDHSREWTVSGHVTDADTKALIGNFRITPGQINEYNQTAWQTKFAVDGTNGIYQTYFSRRAAQPLLKVEAHGYLPQSVTLASQDSPQVDVALHKGSGPSGAVVTAEGKPAAHATLVLLTADNNQAGLNESGLTAYGDKSVEQTADENGYFAFQPVLGMNAVAAASADGFAVMTLEDFAAHGTIRLQPFGKITGTLKRASGPGTNETLDVTLEDPTSAGINLNRPALTDGQGNFAFDQVPAGQVRISYREMGPSGNGWMNQPLLDVDLKSGQLLATNISAPDRVAAAVAQRNFQQPPEPKAIPGEWVKGVVLQPDGQPATDADVALQVQGKYLSLGRGEFDAGSRQSGVMGNTGPDGSFTLPMYEAAQSVIAVNLQGYAQVSLEHLKQSPQITLQPWGRIEGILRVNHHPGTNEIVGLGARTRTWLTRNHRLPGQTKMVTVTNSMPDTLQPPMYNGAAFQAKTDDQGRFVITFVPPGEVVVNRRISLGPNSWTQSPLATVVVRPGETTVTNVGGTGRTVIGRVIYQGSDPLDFKRGFAHLGTPTAQYLKKYLALKTDAERQAFQTSMAGTAAQADAKYYAAILQPDGSFRAQDVLPGRYEFGLQPQYRQMPTNHVIPMYVSAEQVVPPAKDDNDDSTVDLGEVELEQLNMPMQ
jgi:hypothetical protein